MCEYAEYNNQDQLICKPYKLLCLFCRAGNSLRYKNIQEHEEFEDENV